jgi:hypothetical protein
MISEWRSVSKNTATINMIQKLSTHTESVTTTTKYNLDAGFTFWVSQAARTSGKAPIGRTRIGVSQETPITENLYTVLYAKFKELHPTAVDA